MKTLPKVVGLVQAKNEWPLLAISISHALMNHVDEVYAINHAGTDGSYKGLQHLSRLWKDRIHIFNCCDEHYWQEASINALIEMSRASSPDWIYVFDADEFLLIDGNQSLKEILGDTSPDDSAIRYEVQNWISTEDFEEDNLGGYRLLRYRSAPNLFIDLYPEVYADEILKGNLNYYDVPFLSKVIFRDSATPWIAAGSHFLKISTSANACNAASVEIRCVHFPLLSRRKLERKATHGQRMIEDGFSAWHGWQSQMIYRLSQENRLDEFWQAHAISSRGDLMESRTLPCFVIDDGFVQAIEPTLRLLENEVDSSIFRFSTKPDPSTPRWDDTLIPFSAFVRLTRKFQLAADTMRSERDAAVEERDAIINSLTWKYIKLIHSIARCIRAFIAYVKGLTPR